jgi:PKD domain
MQAEAPVAFEMKRVPEGKIEGAFLYFKSGAAAGKELMIGKIVGNTVAVAINPFAATDSGTPESIKVGDEVQIDNSDFLAAQTYHRHQVPTPDYYVWDQFRRPDGAPLYPQRPKLIGPMITYGGAGSLQNGKFKGKMIVVESLMDQDAFPWQADWYRSKVKEHLGSQLDENFRLWFTDHAIHGDQEKQEDPTRTVSYLGILQQALRDVSLWVEKGVPPPTSTSYKVNDGQIVVPATAADRHGIQAVVSLTANGGTRAEVSTGKPVKFSATAELPANTGKIVAAEWDFEGQGTFPVVQPMSKTQSSASGSRVVVTTTYSFTKPGTYFPALRITSQRQGDPTTPYGRIHNLGRVRV